MSLKKPKRVKIGCFTWDIVYKDLKGEDHYGTTKFEQLTITIASQVPIPIQQETLWHEIGHACLHECLALSKSYMDPEDREEEVIIHMQPKTLQVLRDKENRDVKRFILGE